MGSEMEERERWRRERRHEEETTRGWTVVHSLRYILVIFETIHDPMAPYLPSPWPLGTSLSAFAQVVPSPDPQGTTHPFKPRPAVLSPCSSAFVLGVNAASTASVPHTAASDTAQIRVVRPRGRPDGCRWPL